MPKAAPYHHGELRSAVLTAALEVIEESGTARLSLRDLARRAGVSHAAPAHHFGDKAGLLTAIATQGYDRLADVLEAAADNDDPLLDMGVAYVGFATEHRAYFEVMFRPDLYDADDPGMQAAAGRAETALAEGVGTKVGGGRGHSQEVAGVAAWSLVHGFATLWLAGALPGERSQALGADPEVAARKVARVLFPDRP